MIAAQPTALQLRFLQTIQDIAGEHNTHTILPPPINLLEAFSAPGNGHDKNGVGTGGEKTPLPERTP